MRLVRALPGTLGVLAFVLLPAGVAALNLGAGLASLERPRSIDEPRREPNMIVGRYVSSESGDDRIELARVHAQLPAR